jgi:Domain of unknown function (DUF4280)
MGLLVCMGAILRCSFGAAPSALLIAAPHRTFVGPVPAAANIMDHVPISNIVPFGVCTTITNPAVAATTAAALGVLTPAPCVPVTPAPWTPGSPSVLVENMPALNNTSTLMCAWGGVIQVTFPGQIAVQVP